MCSRFDPMNTTAMDREPEPTFEAFPCAECGTVCRDDDSDNVRIGRAWYCGDCASHHPVVVGDVMAALDADDRQDDFNRTRR